MNFLDIPTWILVAQGIVSGIQATAQLTQLVMMISLMNNLSNGEWLLQQARKWGLYFDQKLIEYSNQIYSYFIQVLNGTLFTEEIIDGLMTRLYILIGIYIFFKLCVVAIKYICAPEEFLEAKTGGEALIKRIIYGSVIIIAMPLAFDIAMSIQSAIIEDDVLAKIILPSDAYQEMKRDKDNTGKNLAMMVFLGFFSWNDTIDSSLAPNAYNNYQQVVTYNDAGLFKYKSYINLEKNDEYVISYVPIISTLAIGYLLLQLIRYTLEIALRSIKLNFLQIIAPFSIIKWMLDPADNESLKKWLNTTISTYLLIFIRVISLWIMVMMAYYLKYGVPTSSDGTVSLLTSDTDELLKALIVIAMFAFLKELPKLISDLFGYNLQENETIGGVLNQATGVVKGLALGKVGLETQKPMMTAGIVASGAGAASSGLGTAGKAYSSNQFNSKGANIAHGITSGVSNAGIQGFGQSSSLIAGAISSNYGNTSIGQFTRGTGSATQTSFSIDYRDYGRSEGEIDAAERERENNRKAENIIQQTASSSLSNSSTNNVNSTNSASNTIDLTQGDTFDNFVSSITHQLQSDGYTDTSSITKEQVYQFIQNDPSHMDPKAIGKDQTIAIYNQCSTMLDGQIQQQRQQEVNTNMVELGNIVYPDGQTEKPKQEKVKPIERSNDDKKTDIDA